MQSNNRQDDHGIQVTVHVPKSDSAMNKQTKINRIYDILSPKVTKEH